MSKVCENCNFWCKIYTDDEDKFVSYGECRRYPPVQKQRGKVVYNEISDYLSINTSRWEIFTYNNDWCGEFGLKNDLR
jgi:hypothetical protein